MSTLYRVDWHFTSSQEAPVGRDANYGWVESWGRIGNDPDSVLVAAGAQGLSTWVTLRRQFLASIYRIAYVTCTAIAQGDGPNAGLPVPPITKVRTLYNCEGVAAIGDTVPIPAPPAQVQCAVLVQATVLPTGLDTQTHHKRFWLRGLSSAMITGNVLNPTVESYLAMLRFLSHVANHETGQPPQALDTLWLMYYQTPDIIAPTTVLPIADIAVAADSRRTPTVTLQSLVLPPGFIKGARVDIRGVNQPPGMNRRWKILNADGITPNPTYIVGKSRRDLYPSAQVPFGGFPAATMRLVRLLFNPAKQYSVIRLGSKKTGRPPSLTRGRRSVLNPR